MPNSINFADSLAAHAMIKGNPVVVGLDPRADQLPAVFTRRFRASRPTWQEVAEAYRLFCREIIDVVAPLVPAVKPQAAFFEQCGPDGMMALADVIQYARHRGLIVILDGKRNDIGSTAEAYADAYLGAGSVWGADALTVSPYLGDDSLTPFVNVARQRNSGIFVLVKTSNPGGGQFQDIRSDGVRMYERVAAYVNSISLPGSGRFGYGEVGAVVGATYPEQLSELRAAMPNCWILVPGYGSQGGTALDVQGAFDERGLGAVVNSSRGIIFAHRQKGYQEKFGEARWQAAVEVATCDMIEDLRTHTHAGRLSAVVEPEA
ncbi:MAG: orotidine-5'-phosphate decarboxylase [Pirellulaceae bacterium]|nr:orotidine-5'-phosphate decarboxylase [Planctomycetales bacterium]